MPTMQRCYGNDGVVLAGGLQFKQALFFFFFLYHIRTSFALPSHFLPMEYDDDGLDTLLDDVEARYCKQNILVRKTAVGTSSDDSIDEAIDEICSIPGLHAAERNPPENELRSSDTQCYVVYLGGTDVNFGISTSTSKRACCHMHCCRCDFQVVVFEDFAWNETADYLFFRNNFPDVNKLRLKLVWKHGWRAYCCQCQWRSVAVLTSAQQEKLSWTCAPHC